MTFLARPTRQGRSQQQAAGEVLLRVLLRRPLLKRICRSPDALLFSDYSRSGAVTGSPVEYGELLSMPAIP